MPASWVLPSESPTNTASPGLSFSSDSAVETRSSPSRQSTIIGRTSSVIGSSPSIEATTSSNSSTGGASLMPSASVTGVPAHSGGGIGVKLVISSSSGMSTYLGVSPARRTLSEAAMISTPNPDV